MKTRLGRRHFDSAADRAVLQRQVNRNGIVIGYSFWNCVVYCVKGSTVIATESRIKVGVSFGQIRSPDENPIQFVLTNRSETACEFFRVHKSLFRSLFSFGESSTASICGMILITADTKIAPSAKRKCSIVSKNLASGCRQVAGC
jgi:hypothetical protein